VNLDDIERYLLARGTENACTGVDDLITVHVVGSSDKDLGLLQELVAAYISVHKTAVAIRPVGELPRAESGKVLYSRLMGVDDGS
jgi:acyl-coenzyme A synthetase/AMP-(fatty) acid ligase